MNGRVERTTVLAVYSAFVAACYVAAYWSRFDVNIFQFAGLTGFVSLALYPLMTALSLNVLVLLVVPGLGNKPRKSIANKNVVPPGLAKATLTLWWILGPSGALAAYYLMTNPFKWIFILIGMTPFVHQLAELPIAESIAEDLQHRKNILYWAAAFPCLAALAGGTNARTILNGQDNRIVSATGAAKNLHADETHPVEFLGFAGGTYFLYESKTASIVMLNQAVAEPLTFQPRSRKNSASD